MSDFTRRKLLTNAMATSMALEPMRNALAQSSDGFGEASDVGRKMNADGTVREFFANTFIGPLGQQGEDFAVFDALLDVYREFPRHNFHKKIALLPPSSYHITVFGGLNEVDRGTPRWAHTIPADLPIEDVTERYLRALRALTKFEKKPFQLAVDFERPLNFRGSFYIPLRPVDEDTRVRLQSIRDQLALLTGIRRADHNRYEYHVTLGYFFQSLNAHEVKALAATTKQWMQRVALLRRPLNIDAVHFCRLRDMYAFEQLHQL